MPRRRRRGSGLVEFALISLLLYVLLAGGIDLGRMVFTAQVLNDAARVGARELALSPLPASFTLTQALSQPDVTARVFDPALLVLDMDDSGFETTRANLPLVNRALLPLMIVDFVTVAGISRRFLRYPGALLSSGSAFTVGIPRVLDRGPNGVETIEWIPVMEEVRCIEAGVPTTTFNLDSPCPQAGVAAIVINYPFQAAGLSGFRQNVAGPFEPNIGNPIAADDANVTEANAAPGAPVNNEIAGPYAGPFGLGRQLAFAGQTLRPFRKLISAQAIFRREVFE